MTEILRYLVKYCTFLFRRDGYRFVDSRVDDSFGGDAMVVLESALIRLRFTWDREQLLLDLQPVDGKPSEWFSPGLIRGLLLGDRDGSEALDAEWAHFLPTAVSELEKRFAGPQREATIGALREQARLRAKTLFG